VSGRAGGAGDRRDRAVVAFTFDGRPIVAEAGQSIAAALLAAGIRSWRTTRVDGSPRGMFCGIGVCFDCLVTVDGRANVRACLTEARPGDRVETQRGTGHADLDR
jgi:predicted molibdopterin-dependent oxidoreductase YjgC